MASDLLEPDLRLLFCGYNPSLVSGRTGYHYAHPGNRFWRLLFATGITDRLYRPEADAQLLELGIGFTKTDPPRYNARVAQAPGARRRGRGSRPDRQCAAGPSRPTPT